jgi:hypothetical protein
LGSRTRTLFAVNCTNLNPNTKEKRENAQPLGGTMSKFPDTELQQSETVVAELIENPQASVGKHDGIGNNNVARIAVLSVVAIGILALPLATLLLNRAHLLPKLPILSERTLAP